MTTIRNRLPSPALLVACVALIVSLGGASYAATVLPKNSVGGKQLRNGSVRSRDLHKGAVTPSKVAPNTVALFKGQKGDPGAKGDRGPKGDTGPAGTAKAYGTVSGIGVASRTRNVISVSKSSGFAALYCIDTAVSVENVVATVQTGTPGVGIAVGYGAQGDCPAATDITVRTLNASGSLTDAPFTFLVN